MLLNSNTLKISHLLAQFLYEHKRLDLPGIGHLTLDSTVVIEPAKGKHAKPVELSGIGYIHDAHTEEDPELIAYISAQSGKIKALASADLYSHLELAQQFLNIGKPFLMEGIGSITKTPAGEYLFSPGVALNEKAELPVTHPTQREEQPEDAADGYRGLLYVRKQKKTLSRPVMVLLILAGIIAALWGGYKLYKRSTANKQNETAAPANEPGADTTRHSAAVTDTTKAKPDSLRQLAPPLPGTVDSLAPAVNYKINLETAARDRALARYAKLKSWGWDIQMETKDSISFVLFLRKDIRPVDTTRVLDSLSRAYGRKASIGNEK